MFVEPVMANPMPLEAMEAMVVVVAAAVEMAVVVVEVE